MKLTFFGGAGGVTGSCSLVTTGQHKILVDCGMFQGSHFNEDKNHEPLAFDAQDLTAVIVTHAHLDHVGRLPLLIKNGYSGHFYTTPATAELAQLIMEDALMVMEENNRKYGTPVLYDSTDIAGVVQRFFPVDYYVETVLTINEENVVFKFYDAGHIFGSAFVEINDNKKRVVFSGDIGNVNLPIVRDTDKLPDGLDALICESTYGNRLHEKTDNRSEILEKFIGEALTRGGVIMIPSFSLERTQELLYDLHELMDKRKTLPYVPIFLDSPLAIRAIPVYKRYTKYYDKEAIQYVKEGEDFFAFPGLTLTETKEQSKMINGVPNPKIIIAGSGMMNGGRIQHHAMRYLPDANSTLLIVGYQAEGTVGRKILDGAKHVDIFRERIPVHCQVKAIGVLSAHGDQKKLFDWASRPKNRPKKIILNHGEPGASQALADLLRNESSAVAFLAKEGESVEI